MIQGRNNSISSGEVNNWSADVIQKKLQNINGKFFGKKCTLLQSNLEVRELGLIGRALWSIVKYFKCLRKIVFNVDNAGAVDTLEQLRIRIGKLEERSENMKFKAGLLTQPQLNKLADKVKSSLKEREILIFKNWKGKKQSLCPGLTMQISGENLSFEGKVSDEHLRAMLQRVRKYTKDSKGSDDLLDSKVNIQIDKKKMDVIYQKIGDDYLVSTFHPSGEGDQKTGGLELDSAIQCILKNSLGKPFIATFNDGVAARRGWEILSTKSENPRSASVEELD